jgi:hypothetical protein
MTWPAKKWQVTTIFGNVCGVVLISMAEATSLPGMQMTESQK